MQNIKISCGGVLLDLKGDLKICLVKKLSREEWLLPKGGIKEDEDLTEAGKREVQEETGYTDIKIVDNTPVSRITIYPDNMTIKTIYYFVFKLCSAVQNTNLQDVGEGLQPEWFTVEEAISIVKHDDQKDAIRAAVSRISK
jgi:8-oxo-dGTP pyrophosphatase MutT (NUDIX family)